MAMHKRMLFLFYSAVPHGNLQLPITIRHKCLPTLSLPKFDKHRDQLGRTAPLHPPIFTIARCGLLFLKKKDFFSTLPTHRMFSIASSRPLK